MARPTRPEGQQYALSALFLFPRLTRAGVFAATGKDAPPFKVNEPIKRFVVPSAELTGSLYTYKYVDKLTGKILTNSITNQSALELNLPGLVTYPKYVVAPTQAVSLASTGTGTVEQNINPEYLSLYDDANAVAAELGASAPSESTTLNIRYPANELRRPWNIVLSGGRTVNAGLTLKERNKGGVGAPGSWSSPDSNPQWVAGVQVVVEANLLPEVPIPIGPLFPDEVIRRAFMGPTEDNGWVVQRRSLANEVEDKDKMAGRIREIHYQIVGSLDDAMLVK